MARITLVPIVAALALAGCAYNETLGRNQFLLVDDSSLIQQSNAAWAEALRTQRTSSDAAANARIRRVGDSIVAAAGLGDRNWEYAVFVDQSPNAFVLPSAKIGVTTGLLALVRNDDQLAAVLGHEVGHVVAHHAAERASSSAATNIALSGLSGLAGDYAQTAGTLGSIGAQYGLLLPFSRRDELEADRLGVDYMKQAGYRPQEAITLWQAMAQQGQSRAPEFMSTHPSDTTRVAALQEYINSRGWS
jgi:predicted Zn-dependent protease